MFIFFLHYPNSTTRAELVEDGRRTASASLFWRAVLVASVCSAVAFTTPVLHTREFAKDFSKV